MDNEAYPEAAAILAQSGWGPHPAWGVFTRGTLVMGSPKHGEFHVKNFAAAPDSPDTPDDPVEAARWLVRRFPIDAAPEAAEIQPHESDTQAAAPADDSSEPCDDLGDAAPVVSDAAPDNVDAHDAGSAGGLVVSGVGDDTDEPQPTDVIPVTVDAEFSEPAGDENGSSGAFIFGDNLDQLRTAAIGIVVRRALEMMPSGVDFDRLASLRNFTMGVSEGRWPDDEAKRRELDGLEATLRTIRYIEAKRDEKVAFLVAATRPQIEAFDPEAGW